MSSVKVPLHPGGQPRNITLVILEALYEYLKPTLYLDEIVIFCRTNFPFAI